MRPAIIKEIVIYNCLFWQVRDIVKNDVHIVPLGKRRDRTTGGEWRWHIPDSDASKISVPFDDVKPAGGYGRIIFINHLLGSDNPRLLVRANDFDGDEFGIEYVGRLQNAR